jgi:Zn-dependent peptidase ImmA (M78 family)
MPKLPDYYDRNQLYQEVWEEPIIQVAKRYGVSNVAIAKTCRKMRIPVPGRGYWAKVQNGQKLPKPPLPPYDDCPKIQRIVSSSPSLSVVEPVYRQRVNSCHLPTG